MATKKSKSIEKSAEVDKDPVLGVEEGPGKAGIGRPEPSEDPTALICAQLFEIAKGEIGVLEAPGRADNPRVIEYHQATSLRATQDAVPWCSSFANWVLQQAGLEGTNSARALSWRTWGKGIDLADAPVGAILVFTRRGGGHVGFYTGERDPFNAGCLGGNQGDAVNIQERALSQLVSVRVPNVPGQDDTEE